MSIHICDSLLVSVCSLCMYVLRVKPTGKTSDFLNYYQFFSLSFMLETNFGLCFYLLLFHHGKGNALTRKCYEDQNCNT